RLGTEPRRKCEAVPRFLEGGQAFLERLPRRVAAARVLEAVMFADGVLSEGRGEMDGLNHRAGRGIRPLADVNRSGGEPPALLLLAHLPLCATNSSRSARVITATGWPASTTSTACSPRSSGSKASSIDESTPTWLNGASIAAETAVVTTAGSRYTRSSSVRSCSEPTTPRPFESSVTGSCEMP